MSIALKNQVEASSRSADELLMTDHHDALFAFDVEDFLRQILDAAAAIKDAVVRWQRRIESGMAFDKEEGRSFHRLFCRLEEVFARTPAFLRMVRESGLSIQSVDEFQAAWNDLRAVASVDFDRFDAAAQAIERGEGRALAEVKNALWDAP